MARHRAPQPEHETAITAWRAQWLAALDAGHEMEADWLEALIDAELDRINRERAALHQLQEDA